MKKEGDPIKDAKKVTSKSEIPEGAVLVKGEDGKEYYEVKTKTATPATKNPGSSHKPSNIDYITVRKSNTQAAKPTSKVPHKTTPSPKETVERYYIEPEKKTPAPVDQEKEAFQALGYEGDRKLVPALTSNLPPFYIGGKQAKVSGYLLGAKRDPDTGAWDSNEGTGSGGTKIYGVTDPTTGKFQLVDIDLMQGKERDFGGTKRYGYTEEDIVPYSNPTDMANSLKHGALRQIGDEAYSNSLGIKVDRTKDAIGTINTQGTGYGKEGHVIDITDLPVISSSKISDVEAANKLLDKNKPVLPKRKGGLIEKYDIGGPIINPQIKKYYNQLTPPQNNQTVVDPMVPATDIPAQPKTGLAGKFGALPSAQKASIYSAVGDVAGIGLDVLDRKDERSSIAGQAGVGALKGAGKGAAIGSAIPGVGTAVGAGIGALAGGTIGYLRGKKEKKARIDETAAEIDANVIEGQTFDPMNPNKVFKANNYNEKDYRTGIKGLFAKGGQITGKGTGTSDSVDANLKEGSFVVPAKNAGIANMIRKHMLGKEEKAELKQFGGVPVKVSNGEHLFSPEEVKELSAKGVDLDKLAPEARTKLRAEYKCGGMVPHYATGGSVDGGPDYASMYKKEFKKKYPTKAASKPKGLAALGINSFPEANAADDEIIVPNSTRINEPNPLAVPEQYRLKPELNNTQASVLNQTALTKQAEINNASADSVQTNKSNFGWGDAVGLGLAGLQTGFGIQQLLKDKRPIGQVDPAYNTATEQALAESRYGYTPAQAALLNNQITQGRVAQTAGISALAGGNASVALGNSRAAINSEVANRLKMASEDERLRMQKQQYANQLVGQRANMRRQLFQDNMNKFMQNQEAGSALLGAGIQNIAGAARYNQEKAAQDQINKTMYGYLNNIPK